MYHTFIVNEIAENEAWSSGESEPENEDIDEIDSGDFYYNETQLFEDAHFYLSIKDFEGSSKINRNISFSGYCSSLFTTLFL